MHMIRSIAKELIADFDRRFVQSARFYPISHIITGENTAAYRIVRTSALGRVLGRPLSSQDSIITVEGRRYTRSSGREEVKKTGWFGMGREVHTFFVRPVRY